MKYVRCLLLSLIVVSTASCATKPSPGTYCPIAKILYPSRADVLTEGTKRQILEHNLTYEKICGVGLK